MAWRLLACLLLSARAGQPDPSSWERALFRRVATGAAAASAAAAPRLLARLAEPELRAKIEACSPGSKELTPEALAARLREELRVAEVISGFDSPMWGPLGLDLEEAANGPKHLQGLWEVGMRRGVNFSSATLRRWGNFSKSLEMLDGNERRLYGLRPFAKGGLPSSFEEAEERPAYAMVNVYRLDSGSELYGDVSVVLSQELMEGAGLLSAVDTGSWSVLCNHSMDLPLHLKANCSAYAPFGGLGTLAHFEHLLLANEAFWNASLATAACRLLAPWGSAPVHGIDLLHYWEALPASRVAYPDGIRFVIASFGRLFGSMKGQQLQRWCMANGWVLVWSLGQNTKKPLDFLNAMNMTFPMTSDQRLADPIVLANTTVQLPDATTARSTFRVKWLEARALRLIGRVGNSTWARAWKGLTGALPQSYSLEPLRAGACPRGPEACVGLSRGGGCVCYGDASATLLV